jgi:hypothetical protein
MYCVFSSLPSPAPSTRLSLSTKTDFYVDIDRERESIQVHRSKAACTRPVSFTSHMSRETFRNVYDNTVDPKAAILLGELRVSGFRYSALRDFSFNFDTSTANWDDFYEFKGSGVDMHSFLEARECVRENERRKNLIRQRRGLRRSPRAARTPTQVGFWGNLLASISPALFADEEADPATLTRDTDLNRFPKAAFAQDSLQDALAHAREDKTHSLLRSLHVPEVWDALSSRSPSPVPVSSSSLALPPALSSSSSYASVVADALPPVGQSLPLSMQPLLASASSSLSARVSRVRASPAFQWTAIKNPVTELWFDTITRTQRHTDVLEKKMKRELQIKLHQLRGKKERETNTPQWHLAF